MISTTGQNDRLLLIENARIYGASVLVHRCNRRAIAWQISHAERVGCACGPKEACQITCSFNQEQSKGFTLLELILVMVMISLVLAMAAPSLRGFTAGRRISDTASQILAMTKMARSQAMAEARIYRLNIDKDEHMYWLTRQEGGAFVEIESDHGQFFFLPDNVIFELVRPDDEIDSDQTYIQFYPDGRNDEASIIITDHMGDIIHVACKSATEKYRILSDQEAESSGF